MQDRKAAIAAICERFQVSILYSFGSRSRDLQAWLEGAELEAGQGSDVDVGAKLVPGTVLDVRKRVEFGIALEDLLGVTPVDVVVLDQAGAFLAEEVIAGERLYARDQREADEYDLYVLRRAGDQAHLERERQDAILRGRP